MGKELTTTVRVDRRSQKCKVLLEGQKIVCRAPITRTFARAKMVGLSSKATWLEFEYEGERIGIEVGEKAAEWVTALLNPRTRVQKLGVSAGMKVVVLGDAESDALEEIAGVLGGTPGRRLAASVDVVLLFCGEREELGKLGAIEPKLAERGAVWVLWPKGRREFGHEHVVEAGKKAMLTQTRSMGFSEVFTGLRLVRPAQKSEPRKANK